MQRSDATSRLAGAGLLVAAGIFGLAVLAAGGCGESDREAAFREATEQLGEAEEAVAGAREAVEERAGEAEEARQQLAEAEEELARAEQALAEARARVGLHATDDVLFREVQSRLLEDDLLESLAIAARVEKGIVTLTGEASDPEQRDRAAEIAAAIPGVLDVDNRISLADPEQGV